LCDLACTWKQAATALELSRSFDSVDTSHSRSIHFAQDFGSGLPLRSRPLIASSCQRAVEKWREMGWSLETGEFPDGALSGHVRTDCGAGL